MQLVSIPLTSRCSQMPARAQKRAKRRRSSNGYGSPTSEADLIEGSRCRSRKDFSKFDFTAFAQATPGIIRKVCAPGFFDTREKCSSLRWYFDGRKIRFAGAREEYPPDHIFGTGPGYAAVGSELHVTSSTLLDSHGDKMDRLEERIREQAYHIWKEEGCPEGRAEAHWEEARRVLSPNDSQTQRIRNEIQLETVQATEMPFAAVSERQKQASRPKRTARRAGATKPRSKRPPS
jgi:Protein of unknown function (DUF2934)